MVNKSQVGWTLLRQSIGLFSQLLCPDFLAPYNDKNWWYLCPHSDLVHELRLNVVQLRKISRLSLSPWDLWFDFFVSCYPFRQHEFTFVEDVPDFLRDSNCILRGCDWLEEYVHVKVSLNCFDQTFIVDSDERNRRHRLWSLRTVIWRNIS